MSLLKQKTDYIKRGSFDELYTPDEAIQCILPFIPKNIKTIWECTDFGKSNITKILNLNGYDVISTHILSGFNFFDYEPSNYDLIITNPPYSIKTKFLQRAFSLKKPFLFLLPVTSFEGANVALFNENPVQLIIPNKRFNFKPEKKSGAWFKTVWFSQGLNLNRDLNYVFI